MAQHVFSHNYQKQPNYSNSAICTNQQSEFWLPLPEENHDRSQEKYYGFLSAIIASNSPQRPSERSPDTVSQHHPHGAILPPCMGDPKLHGMHAGTRESYMQGLWSEGRTEGRPYSFLPFLSLPHSLSIYDEDAGAKLLAYDFGSVHITSCSFSPFVVYS